MIPLETLSELNKVKKLRELEMAFNAIRISPQHRSLNLDFAKLKIESLVQVYGFSIGVTSESVPRGLCT